MQACALLLLVPALVGGLPARGTRHSADAAVARPAWCGELLAAQAEGRCVAPFTSIQASLRVSLKLPRDEYLKRVQLANDPVHRRPTWMAGQGQDWWLWYHHARFRHQGTYVDLAANDAIWRSNTYFFDVCLGWRGVLIEPNPVHHARIRKERGGTLVPSCISNITDRDVTFHEGLGWRGGSSKIKIRKGRRLAIRSVRCRALGAVLNEAQIRHVDFLSLDVEGHEEQALSSIDLNAVKVDIIISENPAVHTILHGYGYRHVSALHDHVYLRPGFVLGINRAHGKTMPRLPDAGSGAGWLGRVPFVVGSRRGGGNLSAC